METSVKPLSPRQKEFIWGQLVEGPLRPLARVTYDGIIAAELLRHRLVDAVAALGSPSSSTAPAAPTDHLTAVIKTFERPRTAARLVRSIRRRYPGLPVIVVDDSAEPTHFDGVENLHLPYNSGISAGRNAALERVRTPYSLILDDDFVVTGATDLGTALDRIRNHPEIDIMGGRVVDLPLYIVHDYRHVRLLPTRAAPLRPPGSRVGGLEVLDKVANFFIARTDALRKVGWDPRLKLLEHADFFTRARGVLLTVYNPDLSILHARTPFDRSYMNIRHDMSHYQAILHAKYHRPAGRDATSGPS